VLLPAKEAGQGGVPKRCTTNRPAIGGPFKLYDTKKNVVTESELRGNWTLMYFGYTSCPDLGPRQVQKIADVVKVLGELLCSTSCVAAFLLSFKYVVGYS
jgi:protein SCO1